MLWKPGEPIEGKSRILVRQDDLDNLRLELLCVDPPLAGLEVIVLTARAAEHSALVDAIANAKDFDRLAKQPTLDRKAATALIERFDPALREALTGAIEFLHAVWLKDSTECLRLAESLGSTLNGNKAIPPSSRNWASRLVRYLALVVDSAVRMWSWPTVYEHPIPQVKYRSWWNFEPTVPQQWIAVSAQYPTIVTRAAPPDVAAVQVWINNFQIAASRLKLQGQASESICFFCASAYLMTLAEYFLVRRQPILVLLAIHRAAEWLMVARLAQSNSLTYTQGIQMKQGSEEVTFKKSLMTCLLQGIVTPTEKAVLENLNEWRNLLIYTHHMSSPPEKVVDDLISDVRKIVRRVGASDWQQHYGPLSSEMPVDFALLLDPGSFLRNGMRVVPSKELAI